MNRNTYLYLCLTGRIFMFVLIIMWPPYSKIIFFCNTLIPDVELKECCHFFYKFAANTSRGPRSVSGTKCPKQGVLEPCHSVTKCTLLVLSVTELYRYIMLLVQVPLYVSVTCVLICVPPSEEWILWIGGPAFLKMEFQYFAIWFIYEAALLINLLYL